MTHPVRKFTGVIPPIVTPLTADRDVDVPSLERLIRHLLDNGVHGIFALGSTGEVVLLDDDRRDRVLEVVTATVAGQVPVVAGCIETSTTRVLQRVRAAEKYGADAVVVTAPFYALVGPAEIDRHFRAVAGETSLPVLAYDIPACVQVKLTAEHLLALAADGVIYGVKDSSGDDVAFRKLLIDLEDLQGQPGTEDERSSGSATNGFVALTGHEVMVDGMLLAGAHGSVPGLGNVDPAGYVRLTTAAAHGDWATARAEQDRLTRLFRIVDAADPDTAGPATRGVSAFKTALALLGIIDTPTVSLPLRALQGHELNRVRDQLEIAGLLPTPSP
ncbi:MAG: dihydrodipicolinate synthase family protein [Lapillicoccus sp.]